MSFPPGTEMFQFPGFAFMTYGFSHKYPHVTLLIQYAQTTAKAARQASWNNKVEGGFPHSEMSWIKARSRLPETLSQRTTSFIASQHQGIHRDTLITLDRFSLSMPVPLGKQRANHATRFPRRRTTKNNTVVRTRAGPADPCIPKTILLQTLSAREPMRSARPMMHHAVAAKPTGNDPITHAQDPPCSSLLERRQIPPVSQSDTTASEEPSTGSGCDSLFTMSNNPPFPFQPESQEPKDKRNRFIVDTPQSPRMVEPDGIEPTTSCLQSRRSPS